MIAIFNPLNGHIYTGGVDNWIGIWSDTGSYVNHIYELLIDWLFRYKNCEEYSFHKKWSSDDCPLCELNLCEYFW